MAKKTGNIGFGNLSGLRPINTTTTTIVKRKVPKTRTIEISEDLYQRFREHSRRHYNIETYETIIKDLLDCYSKHNDTKWF
jgi:hypothetical protein